MKKIYVLIAITFMVILPSQGQTFDWAKTFGSATGDTGNASAVDASGNVYTTGSFTGSFDADPGVGVTTLTNNAGGGFDFYITKLDASGNFVWAKKIGGSDFDQAYSIAVDPSGNIYLVGYFAYVVDFNPNAGVNNMGAAGVFTQQGFLLKLDTDGNYLWSKQLSTANVLGNQVIPTSVTLDSNNNVILGGYFKGLFANEAESFNSISNSVDFFVTKYTSSGTYQWVKRVGSSGNESVNGLTADANGNIYITGNFGSVVDFDPSTVVQNLGPMGGTYDSFLLKFNASGNYQWVKNVGGGNDEYGRNVAVNAAGEVYMALNFTGQIYVALSPTPVNIASNGSTDNAIVKFDNTGTIIWAKTFGGTGAEYISSITCDAAGNVFSTGYFNGTVDFNPNAAINNLTTNGGNDVFVLKLDASGNFGYANRFGSTGNDVGNFIRVDAANNIITTGNFSGTCYFNPSTSSSDSQSSAGADDGFVHRMTEANLGTESYDWNAFRLYPNPSTGIFTLNSPLETKFTILNAMGQIVKNGNVVFGENQIDIQNQANGLYFLQFEKGKTLKLIKQ